MRTTNNWMHNQSPRERNAMGTPVGFICGTLDQNKPLAWGHNMCGYWNKGDEAVPGPSIDDIKKMNLEDSRGFKYYFRVKKYKPNTKVVKLFSSNQTL